MVKFALRAKLALAYGVPETDIDVAVEGGSIIVHVGISALTAADLAALNQTILALDDAELSSYLGVNATRSPDLMLATVKGQ